MPTCCKIINVVGNSGSPSKADKRIAVPTKRGRRKTLCNCVKKRGKHKRDSDCISMRKTRKT